MLLVVDDDYDIASLIKIGLEKIGRSVSSFIDPSIALEEFSKNSSDYELVISDIRMPGMNGYEFIKQIKKINPKVNVILMTAFEIEDKEFHSILPSIRIDGFLPKPFSITELDNMIRKIS